MRLLMFRDGAGGAWAALRDGGPEVGDLAAAASARALARRPPTFWPDHEGDRAARVPGLLDAPEAVPAPLCRLGGPGCAAPARPATVNVVRDRPNYASTRPVAAGARRDRGARPADGVTKAITSIAGPYDEFRLAPAVSEQSLGGRAGLGHRRGG